MDRQVSRLREAGCDEIIEELISGGDNERPGILQLIKLIERRQVDEILLTRLIVLAVMRSSLTPCWPWQQKVSPSAPLMVG